MDRFLPTSSDIIPHQSANPQPKGRVQRALEHGHSRKASHHSDQLLRSSVLTIAGDSEMRNRRGKGSSSYSSASGRVPLPVHFHSIRDRRFPSPIREISPQQQSDFWSAHIPYPISNCC